LRARLEKNRLGVERQRKSKGEQKSFNPAAEVEQSDDMGV
jgi:hypothetical protein